MYLAILFYMGIHIENDTRAYQSRRKDRPIHIAVHRAMRENRWHYIYHTFSISDPTIPRENTTVFQRVEPLNSHIQEASRRYQIPSRDLVVGECMERFIGQKSKALKHFKIYIDYLLLKGRSYDIMIIPSKPISTGYKVWAIAQLRYILSVISSKQERPYQFQGSKRLRNQSNLGRSSYTTLNLTKPTNRPKPLILYLVRQLVCQYKAILILKDLRLWHNRHLSYKLWNMSGIR